METSAVVDMWLADQRGAGRAKATLDWNAKYGRIITELWPEWPAEPLEISRGLGDIAYPTKRFHLYQNLNALGGFAERAMDLPNPCKRVKAPRKPKTDPEWMSMAQIRAVFANTWSARDKALMTLAIGAGPRPGEIAGLRYEDIQFGVDEVTGLPVGKIHVAGKTGERWIPLPPTFFEQVIQFGRTGYVFRHRKTGKPLSVHTICNMVRRRLRAARLPLRLQNPYTCRHTFGRHYWLATRDPYKVMVAMGHTNVQQTMHYCHPGIDDITTDFSVESPVVQAGIEMQLPLLEAPVFSLAPVRDVATRYLPVRRQVTDLWKRYPDRLRGPSDKGLLFAGVVTLREKARLTGLHPSTLAAIRDGRSSVSDRAAAAIRAAWPDVRVWEPDGESGE